MTRSLLRAQKGALVWLFSMSLVACGGAMAPEAAPPAYEAKTAAPADVAMASGGGAAPMPVPGQPQTTSPIGAKSTPQGDNKPVPEATVQNALVIYTGNVSMLEDQEKIPALIDKLIDLSESMGGRMQARRDDGVQIRVPSAHFREAMTKIDGLGAVTHRSVKADDVSEEYHDAEVRLLNLKATRQRLQEFLQRSSNMNEALQIEHELERVAQEIDRLQGRMRFLNERASMSIIDIAIAAKPRLQPIANDPNPKQPRPEPKGIELPVDWLDRLGTPNLSNLK